MNLLYDFKTDSLGIHVESIHSSIENKSYNGVTAKNAIFEDSILLDLSHVNKDLVEEQNMNCLDTKEFNKENTKAPDLNHMARVNDRQNDKKQNSVSFHCVLEI